MRTVHENVVSVLDGAARRAGAPVGFRQCTAADVEPDDPVRELLQPRQCRSPGDVVAGVLNGGVVAPSSHELAVVPTRAELAAVAK